MDITKDEIGFIWVYTTRGVYRFDGYRFIEYRVGIDNLNRALSYWGKFMKDSKNRIWIESDSPALFLYDIVRDRINIGYRIKNQDFYELADDGEGNFLITGSNNKLFLLHEDSEFDFTVKEYAMLQETGLIGDIYWYEDGTILATAQNGLFELIIGEGMLRSRKIKVLKSGSKKEYKVDADTRFLAADEKLYLVTGNEILNTSLPVSGSFSESLIHAEPLEIDSPKTGLYPGQEISSVIKGGRNELFIRNSKGIYRFNTQNKTIDLIKNESIENPHDHGGQMSRSALLYDKDGILWAGTEKGLLKIVFGNKPFHTIRADPENPEGLRVGHLCKVLIDSRDHLWVGTVRDGLYHSIPDPDGEYRAFNNFVPDSSDHSSIHSSLTMILYEDSQHRLWVGANNLQWMDLNNEQGVFHYTPASSYARQMGMSIFPKSILEDSQGNLIVSNGGSLPSWLVLPSGNEAFAIVLDSAKTTMYWPYFWKTSDHELYFFEDCHLYQMKSGWILNEAEDLSYSADSTTLGNYAGRALVPWVYPAKLDTLINLDSLNSSRAEKMLITENTEEKEVWFPMYLVENLLYANLDSLKMYANSKAGESAYAPGMFPADIDIDLPYIFEIIEDKNGHIWCSTSNGLIYIDPLTMESHTYFQDDGLPSRYFYWGAHLRKNGKIYMCTTNGLLYFDPDSIKPDPPPKVILTDFEYFNKSVQPGPTSLLKESVTFSNNLALNHDQNFIGFRFTALDYRNTGETQFKYKLEGLDRNWISADERRLAEYPNLRPGRYQFRVIAANGNGVWNMDGASIDIWIKRPMWFTWWAFLIEFLILTLLIAAYIRFRERNLKREAIRLERQVDAKTHEILEQRKEVDELKSRFYANISHEFRTPLTLLVGPLEDSVKKPEEEVMMRKGILRTMLRNTRRLQRLINQLLDISKLESGKLELQLVKGNLSDFVKAISGSFHSLADSNNITYRIEVEEAPEDACFDPDKTEKIIVNLLSNAFKFTPPGESVSLKLYYQEPATDEGVLKAHIEIKDTGKGIEEKELGRIFERFYQVADSDTREVEGTGIGLALTREMAELMHGKIDVESNPGLGTTFRVSFPVSEQCFAGNVIGLFQPGDILAPEFDTHKEDQDLENEKKGGSDRRKLILVVEDNADLRKYIRDQLETLFRIEEARNGKSGLEKTQKMLPDLVITDLMMPEMGGAEMCEKLKTHPATNHIPVIMLTAKADRESKLKGLETGADDYIIKPFDSSELSVRARNLIHQRERLWVHFQGKYLLEDDVADSSLQFKKLRELVSVIDRHMDDPGFNLKQFGEELNISRTQLYRKIHHITGGTPNELIRMVRMKRAANLIRKGEMNITQVMYQVGMKNQSFFASSFRKYYGVNPSHFRRSE